MPEIQGSPASGSAAEPQFESFADMPEAPMPFESPRMLFGDRASMEAELDHSGGSLENLTGDQPANQPAETPTTTEQPPIPGMTPADIQAAFRGALAEHEQSREQSERSAREAQEAWALPQLTQEQAAEALSSPERLAALFTERDNLHNQRLAATVQQFHNRFLGQEGTLRGLLEDAHAQAWDIVREKFKESGVNADKYYGEMEMALRQNPQRYWNVRRDARAMAAAVTFLHERATRGDIFSAAPQTPQGPPSFAGGTQRGTAANKTDNMTDPYVQRAERILGIKFDKDSRADYFGGNRRSA